MIKIGKVYDHWMVDLKPTSRSCACAARGSCGPRAVGGRAGPALSGLGGRVKTAC